MATKIVIGIVITLINGLLVTDIVTNFSLSNWIRRGWHRLQRWMRRPKQPQITGTVSTQDRQDINTSRAPYWTRMREFQNTLLQTNPPPPPTHPFKVGDKVRCQCSRRYDPQIL